MSEKQWNMVEIKEKGAKYEEEVERLIMGSRQDDKS